MDSKNTGKSEKYPFIKIDLSPDPNTNELISRILSRDKEGIDKFKVTMREKQLANPTDAKYWLQEALEEGIDLVRYLIESIHSYNTLLEEHKKLQQKHDDLKKSYEFMKRIWVKNLKNFGKVIVRSK